MVLVLSALSFICLFCVIYPYLVYAKILGRLPYKPIFPQPGYKISATLVFCAYNEAASLSRKLENIALLKARHPDLEVLAFDDGSTDESLALLKARPDLLSVVAGGGRNGKAFGMKLLAARAKGEILIFTDANVTLREDAVDALMAWYADLQVGGVCGSLVYLGADHTTTANVGSRYWQMEEKLKAEESRTGNVMGADGSIFSIRRNLYPDFPDTVLDDLTVSMHVVFAGLRLIKVEDVVAYETAVAKRSDEVARKVRIAARAFHTHTFLKTKLAKMSDLDKFKYGSRKMLRWFGGGFLVLGLILMLAATATVSPLLAVLILAVGAATLVVGLRKEKGALASIIEIVIALLATQHGVLRAMRGQTFAVWNPAKSRR
jgi:cellulose synthase/poly-beta-1,6-N-acetylglucosamine synthase-like glycosyltransferase